MAEPDRPGRPGGRPGVPGTELRYIDARDLAGWLLDAAARGLHGAYNTVSRPGHATMGELLAACVAATGSDAELRWTDAGILRAAGAEPWSDLPIWLPPGELYDTLHRGGHTKAHAAGLRCRPVGETVADTWSSEPWAVRPPGVPTGRLSASPRNWRRSCWRCELRRPRRAGLSARVAPKKTPIGLQNQTRAACHIKRQSDDRAYCAAWNRGRAGAVTRCGQQ